MPRNARAIRLLTICFTPFRYLFRIQVSGLERLPERPCLLVANHSIGAVYEIFALLDAWERYFAPRGGRPAFGLAHRVSFRVPIVSSIMPKIGAIPATFESAKAALTSGGSVIVFPGGNWEATRSFNRGNEVDFHGHRGWIRVAQESGAPVVPVSISGSYATNPVLGRSRILAKLSLLDFLFGVRWIPVTVGQFVWAGLFFWLTHHAWGTIGALVGSFVVFCFTPLVAIWPAKIRIRLGDAIESKDIEDHLLEQTVLAAIRQGIVL